MANSRTIPNEWKTRTFPDIFYEEPEIAEDAAVGETALMQIKGLLWQRYGGLADVFIAGMVYVAYDKSDGNRRVQPDCIISFDVDAEAIRWRLPNYWIWEAGKAPDFVMEVGSPSTAQNDLRPKRDLYGRPMRGLRLVDGEYQPIDIQIGEDGSLTSHSGVLNLDFYHHEGEFDVLDPDTGSTIDELTIAHEDLRQMQERLDLERETSLVERQARLAAEAENASLREQLRRLQGQ
ncbi:MAG: Uma2 family endonuclease [Chloroflexi bacterium]|nr:Uma2 family endonuclease [Chloroflexota bacterium]